MTRALAITALATLTVTVAIGLTAGVLVVGVDWRGGR